MKQTPYANPDPPTAPGQALRGPLATSSAGGFARLARLQADESGQTLVLAALCLIVLIGFLGLAVDAGVLRYQKRQLQNLADAAALAGALEVAACKGTANCTALQMAAQDALTENGFSGSALLTNCASRSGTKLEVSVNNAPCALANDPNKGNTSYVEVVVSAPINVVFARVLGMNSVLMMARAEAMRPPVTCAIVLDPSASSAALVDSGTTITADCRMVVESTSPSSVQCTSSSVTATILTLVGNGTASNCSVNGTLQLNARLPNPADPLSSLAKPAIPACGTTTQGPVLKGSPSALIITGTVTLYPDRAYCGGITITNGAKVTFQPGVFVLGTSNSAGGLAVDVGATVNGTGVTIYNYGSSGAITFSYSSFTSGGVSLVAPTSGPYSGILLYQDPGNTTQATLLGSRSWNTVLQGAYYFPTAKVVDTYSGSAAYNILIAYDVEFASTSNTTLSTFVSDYSSLDAGSPLVDSGAYLVQ